MQSVFAWDKLTFPNPSIQKVIISKSYVSLIFENRQEKYTQPTQFPKHINNQSIPYDTIRFNSSLSTVAAAFSISYSTLVFLFFFLCEFGSLRLMKMLTFTSCFIFTERNVSNSCPQVRRFSTLHT